ncbi:MAG TPA: phosphotransferase [Jiangellaceae bacterium]|nr:phosphotransferase [Jiangellaceae bacterium]
MDTFAAPADWVAAHAGFQHVLSLVRERPWGRIYRYGELWFKVNGGGTTYEPALLELVKGRPLTPSVVATEPSRGWTLLADAGRSMREIGGSDDEVIDRWLDVLARYARLQQSFADSAKVALRAGVPDHSAQSLLTGLRRLASSSSRADELLALDLTSLAETLDGSRIPATLEHGDLHDANVFVDAAGRVSVIDWGDAAIGHPFLSLQAVQWLGMGLSWEPDDVRLDAIRDVYLAEWGDPGALRPVADAALGLANIGRALSWSRALRDAPSEAHAQWDHPVTRWIEELLPPAL